jgi:hypothetical protein
MVALDELAVGGAQLGLGRSGADPEDLIGISHLP